MHKSARRAILRARKSVHANIKFVEPCKTLRVTNNQKIVEGIVNAYKNHPNVTEIKGKVDKFAETKKSDFHSQPITLDYDEI